MEKAEFSSSPSKIQDPQSSYSIKEPEVLTNEGPSKNIDEINNEIIAASLPSIVQSPEKVFCIFHFLGRSYTKWDCKAKRCIRTVSCRKKSSNGKKW